MPKFVVKNEMFSCFGHATKSASKFEARCRKIFEKHYHAKFKTIRPDWLRNPKTGQNLELDGFYRNIAFEANGIQHYEYNPHFHDSYDEYEDQVYRDKLKIKLCKKRGVYLISIRYDVQDLESYILSKLPNSHIQHKLYTSYRSSKTHEHSYKPRTSNKSHVSKVSRVSKVSHKSRIA